MMSKKLLRRSRQSRPTAALEWLENRQLLSATLGGNLIVNPGAEASAGVSDTGSALVPDGWTVNGGATAVNYNVSGLLSSSDPGPASKGNNYFAGGPGFVGSESDLFQTIDVSKLAHQIDAGNLHFDLSGYLGGLGAASNDATVFANFKQANGAFTGQSHIGPVAEADRGGITELLLRDTTGNVPTGTRTIQIQIHFTSSTDGYTAGFADNLSLVLGNPATITLSESITKLPLPAAVVAGSKTSAKASIKITNTGNTASTNTTVKLYASPDGTVPSGTLITTYPKPVSVAAGKTATVNVPLVSFPNVSSNNYFIVAQITDSNGTVSTVTFATPVNIAPPKIDLVNHSVTAPATAKVGSTMSITISLTNIGNIPATGSLQVSFSLSTSSNGANPISMGTVATKINLKPGIPKTLHLKPRITPGLPTGNQFLVATLDPSDLLGDVDGTNNIQVTTQSILVT